MENYENSSFCKSYVVFLIVTILLTSGVVQAGQKAFIEKEVMTGRADKEHVFNSLLLAAISVDDPGAIWSSPLNYETRNSLVKIRNAYKDPEATKHLQLHHINDLIYAYSWSDTMFMWFLGSSLINARDRVLDIAAATNPALRKQWVDLDEKGKAVFSAVVGGLGFISMTGFTWLVSSYFLIPAAAWELGSVMGNIHFAGPYALDYYTDRVISGSNSLRPDYWASQIYQYDNKTGKEYYDNYINMETFYKLLTGLLSFEKPDGGTKVQFGHVPEEIGAEIDAIHTSNNLKAMIRKANKIKPCHRISSTSSFNSCHASNKTEVAKVTSDTECRKYTFYNVDLHTYDTHPIFIMSLCGSTGAGKLAFARLFGSKHDYARMSKSQVTDFVNDLAFYTGATAVTSQAESN